MQENYKHKYEKQKKIFQSMANARHIHQLVKS